MRQKLEDHFEQIIHSKCTKSTKNAILKGHLQLLRNNLETQLEKKKEREQQEIIAKMRNSCQDQIRQKEAELIKFKKELHSKLDALDDLQYELQITNANLQNGNQTLVALDQSIRQLMDTIQKSHKTKKSQRISTSQSIDEGHKNSFNFMGMFKGKNADDNVDKVDRYNTSRVKYE